MTTCIVVAGEDCWNGTIHKSANTDSKVNGTSRMLLNNEILFGINSSPPWYLVVAYALQVRVLSLTHSLFLHHSFLVLAFVERSRPIIQFIIIAVYHNSESDVLCAREFDGGHRLTKMLTRSVYQTKVMYFSTKYGPHTSTCSKSVDMVLSSQVLRTDLSESECRALR